MSYYLFEKDLTSKHVSYHYCFLDCENVLFNEKSKIKKDYENISDLINNHLFDVQSISSFHKAITPKNNFIEVPYFHLSLNATDKDYLIINDCFKIKTEYKYCYFTKKIPDLTEFSDFKCGFLLDEYLKINHIMENHSVQIADTFSKCSSQILYAFDFDKEGNVNHDNINIEILPVYSEESFLEISKKIMEMFPHVDVNVLKKYKTMFLDYYPEKFHFHFKIKLYSDQKETVKFYRTYNSKNPYLR